MDQSWFAGDRRIVARGRHITLTFQAMSRHQRRGDCLALKWWQPSCPVLGCTTDELVGRRSHELDPAFAGRLAASANPFRRRETDGIRSSATSCSLSLVSIAVSIDRLRDDIWKLAHLIFTVTRPAATIRFLTPSPNIVSHRDYTHFDPRGIDQILREVLSLTPKIFAPGRVEPDDRLGHARSQSTNCLLSRTALEGSRGHDVVNPRLSRCQARASWLPSSGPRHGTSRWPG